jgi:hypothetical protein
MARRNRVVFLLVMPIAAFLWFVGWGLSFVGSKKSSKKIQTKLAVSNNLEVFVATLEKKYAA